MWNKPMGRTARIAGATCLLVAVTLWFVVTYAGIQTGRRTVERPDYQCNTQKQECAAETLKAEQRGAYAAQHMVDLTLWQLVFGAVGIYLLARTLIATRAAVEEARAATEAANRSVLAAERQAAGSETLGRKQTQAYVAIQSGYAAVGDGFVEFSAFLHNSGKSPAYDCHCSVQVVSVEPQGDRVYVDLAEDTPEGMRPSSSLLIMPGGTEVVPNVRVPVTESFGVQAPYAVILYVAISYETMGKMKRFNYRGVVDYRFLSPLTERHGMAGLGVQLVPLSRGNDGPEVHAFQIGEAG